MGVMVRMLLTTCACLAFGVFLIGLLRKRYKRAGLIWFVIGFEVLGYWWGDNWIGYSLIALGLFVLPLFVGRFPAP
jgi:hypothetical protein